MRKKAIVLFSGGLDSTLVVRILQEQGVEIEAINFRTAFACCKDDAQAVARKFGFKVTMISAGDDYFKVIEKPKYGWGRGINPCVDCRIYMFRLARKFMDVCGASFVASGEVLGQRPMSQQMHQLQAIEKDSGLEGLLLRPLSAKFLEPTLPERLGVVDREKLYGISGRSRKELLDLAEQFGIDNPPTPSNGCILTEPEFAKKVRDLFENTPDYERWHFELLKVGRHFRLSSETKVILGKDEEQNNRLEALNHRDSVLLIPMSFTGPSALIVGRTSEEAERRACSLILHFSRNDRKSPEGETIIEDTFERRQNGNRETVSYNEPVYSGAEVASLRIQ